MSCYGLLRKVLRAFIRLWSKYFENLQWSLLFDQNNTYSVDILKEQITVKRSNGLKRVHRKCSKSNCWTKR